jgi:hypothetical protein
VHHLAEKSTNCSQEWDKAYVENGLHLRKLNTLMKTRYCSIFILDGFFKFEFFKKKLESDFATNVFVIIL